MKLNNLLLIFLLAFLIITGCQEDSILEEINEMDIEEVNLCPSQYDADTLFLTQGTLDKFPYKADYFLDSIFFESEDGNRVFAEKKFTSPKISYGGRLPNVVPCLYDSTDEVRVNLNNEIIGYTLIVNELQLDFTVGYRVWQDMLRYEDNFFYEIGSIRVSSQTDDPYFIIPIPQISLTLQDSNWPRNISNPVESVDELTLNGNLYNSVFVNNTGQDKFELYFNFEKGIVAFRDNRNGTLYTLVE